MRMASDEAKKLLKRFYLLQEERVHTYQLFEEGHIAYLSSAPNYNFPMYRELVYRITQTFKKISEEIISIEKKLKSEHDLPNVALFIGKVQDDEKVKLELTARLQIAKQSSIDHAEEMAYKEEVIQIQEKMRDVVERINEHLEELKYESESLYS